MALGFALPDRFEQKNIRLLHSGNSGTPTRGHWALKAGCTGYLHGFLALLVSPAAARKRSPTWMLIRSKYPLLPLFLEDALTAQKENFRRGPPNSSSSLDPTIVNLKFYLLYSGRSMFSPSHATDIPEELARRTIHLAVYIGACSLKDVDLASCSNCFILSLCIRSCTSNQLVPGLHVHQNIAQAILPTFTSGRTILYTSI